MFFRCLTHVRKSLAFSFNIETADSVIDPRGDDRSTSRPREADDVHIYIQIKVRDGMVTLTGKVSSYAERSLARGAAWSAPGVHAVVDDIEVE